MFVPLAVRAGDIAWIFSAAAVDDRATSPRPTVRADGLPEEGHIRAAGLVGGRHSQFSVATYLFDTHFCSPKDGWAAAQVVATIAVTLAVRRLQVFPGLAIAERPALMNFTRGNGADVLEHCWLVDAVSSSYFPHEGTLGCPKTTTF